MSLLCWVCLSFSDPIALDYRSNLCCRKHLGNTRTSTRNFSKCLQPYCSMFDNCEMSYGTTLDVSTVFRPVWVAFQHQFFLLWACTGSQEGYRSLKWAQNLVFFPFLKRYTVVYGINDIVMVFLLKCHLCVPLYFSC